MKILIVAIVLLVGLFCGVAGGARRQESAASSVTTTQASDYEMNSAFLEQLAEQAKTKNEKIFIISRSGTGEISPYVGQLRLMRARKYLLIKLKPESVITSVGEPVRGPGRLEFYMGSRLMIISEIPRPNVMFAVFTDCEAPCTISPKHARKLVEEERAKDGRER